MLSGIMGIGIAAALIMIPALPEMMETIEKDEDFCNMYQQKNIETVISSIFVTFHSVGEMAGPMLNSILMSNYGFKRAHEIFAAYVLVFAVVYFGMCGNISMFIQSWDPSYKLSTVSDEEDKIFCESDELLQNDYNHSRKRTRTCYEKENEKVIELK